MYPLHPAPRGRTLLLVSARASRDRTMMDRHRTVATNFISHRVLSAIFHFLRLPASANDSDIYYSRWFSWRRKYGEEPQRSHTCRYCTRLLLICSVRPRSRRYTSNLRRPQARITVITSASPDNRGYRARAPRSACDARPSCQNIHYTVARCCRRSPDDSNGIILYYCKRT